MRVLIYIEPHPIRDSHTHFLDIAKKFLPLIGNDPETDVRIFMNNETYSNLKGLPESITERIIKPTLSDSSIFNSYMKDWITEGIELWTSLMDGTGKITEDYIQVLQRIWQKFPFDIIVNWGENGAINRFINAKPITRIAMELGCTRPPFLNSLVFDIYGTNGAAIVPKLSIDDLISITNGEPMSASEALIAYSENLEARPYEQQFSPSIADLLQSLSTSEKIAFFPLQLFDDANLIRFSPYSTLSEVVLDVIPKLADAGYTVIITPHPATKHRPQSAFESKLAKANLKNWHNNIVWLEHDSDRPDNTTLITMSDVVITVNSSVGFEALYFDKPVVVLGDAVYKPKNLFPTLDDYISGKFDKAKYLNGISHLRRFFLGGYLQNNRTLSERSNFRSKISILHRLSLKHKNNPVEVAKQFWNTNSLDTQTYAEMAAFAGRSVPKINEFTTPVINIKDKLIDSHYSSEENAWQEVIDSLIEISKADNKSDFISWIEYIINNHDHFKMVIKQSGMFDEQDYIDIHQDVKNAGVDPSEHYALQGFEEKRSPRKHISGVGKVEFIEKIENHIANLDFESLRTLPTYPLNTEDENIRIESLSNADGCLKKSHNKIAVVAHLYYTDIVSEILSQLQHIKEEFDFIVTLPTWGNSRIKEIVRAQFPKAIFYYSANRGRDIGPFIDILPLLINKNYDLILKIQTKRGYYVAGKLQPHLGKIWREEAFNSLVGSPERVNEIIKLFRTNDKLSMIGPASHYLSLTEYPYQDGGRYARRVANSNSAQGFFAGTMFWFRANCLSKLILDLNLSIKSFPIESGATDGTIAHIIERLFGHLATDNGLVMASSENDISIEKAIPIQEKMHDRITAAFLDKQKSDNKKTNLLWS